MEIVEILMREIVTMRKRGCTQKQITTHVDRVIAAHNLRMLLRMKSQEIIQGMVAEALS